MVIVIVCNYDQAFAKLTAIVSTHCNDSLGGEDRSEHILLRVLLNWFGTSTRNLRQRQNEYKCTARAETLQGLKVDGLHANDHLFLQVCRSVTAILKSPLDFLQEGEQLVKKIGGVFAFKVKDGPGGKEATWVVDVKNGKGSVSNDSGMDLSDCQSFSLLPGLYSSICCSAVRLKHCKSKTPTLPLYQQQYVCVPRFSPFCEKSFIKSFIMCFSLYLDNFPYFCYS